MNLNHINFFSCYFDDGDGEPNKDFYTERKFLGGWTVSDRHPIKGLKRHAPSESLPSLINVPKDGVVGGTPTPKKLNVDSAIIAKASPMVPITNTGRKIFGKICLNIIIIFETPIIVDAET